MKLKSAILICFIIAVFTFDVKSQIFPNSDFETGPGGLCNCATGYTCKNDAGRVVDGINPLYTVASQGCTGTQNYTNPLGAFSGKGYVYFYAGGDEIKTPTKKFSGGEKILLSVWYAGPQGTGAPGQNTSAAHFSFGIDGKHISPDIPVPVDTKWTKYNFKVTMTADSHNFSILSGDGAPYSMWFDNFEVGPCNLPTINIGRDTVLCVGETITLDVTTSDFSYLWQDHSTNPTYNVSKAGTYWVQVTNLCGTKTDTIKVKYISKPLVDLGNDTTLCSGEKLLLNATNPNCTFLWNDQSVQSTFSITQAGNYWVQVKNKCGSISDTIHVQYIPLPSIVLGNDTTLCKGDTLVKNATFLNATYQWQDGSVNPVYSITHQGKYWVVINNKNCFKTDTLNINYDSIPPINVGNDTIICRYDSKILNVTTSNSTYLWQDNSTNPTYIITEEGIYWVNVTNKCGSKTDSIQINLKDCEVFLKMPNVFTPNNDLKNDFFLPMEYCGIKQSTFLIFNRWGQQLFESQDLKSGWDGTYHMKECSPGTYYWIVEYSDIFNNPASKTGTVTLLR